MLRGRFGHANKRPYIQGRLFIPRLEVWSDVSFLVDTGADKTSLLPADGSTEPRHSLLAQQWVFARGDYRLGYSSGEGVTVEEFKVARHDQTL